MKCAPTFCSIPRVSGCRAKLVDMALANGKIFEGDGFKYIKESFNDGTLHFIGLLSDGGVHSRLDQLQVSLFCCCSSSGNDTFWYNFAVVQFS